MKKIITGDIKFDPREDYSNVEEITGSLDCRGADTKAAFPRLTTVGGSLYCSGADTKAAFPKLTTVGGWLDCNGADTKAAFPRLTTVGGSLDCRGADTKAAFPRLSKTNCGNAVAARKVAQVFKRKGFLFADGLLAKIVETKRTANVQIHKIQIIGKTKTSICLESDGVFSHGDTIKEARESLLYKVGERDKSAYQKWTLETKITKRQAVESYRIITGACEAGVRHFVESNSSKCAKGKYTVKEVITITQGQYGNDCYANFFLATQKN